MTTEQELAKAVLKNWMSITYDKQAVCKYCDNSYKFPNHDDLITLIHAAHKYCIAYKAYEILKNA